MTPTPPLARRRCAWLAAAAWCLLAGAAQAHEDSALRVPLLPAYQQECAACHIAYPPALLPLASWQRLLANLPKHYGSDASLDAETLRQISTWIAPQAGTARRLRRDATPPPEDRITRSAWFIRKHDEVPAAVWQRASVKRASNCMACHTGADKGDFDDDRVRIPR